MTENVKLGDFIDLIKYPNEYMVLTYDGSKILYDSEKPEKYKARLDRQNIRLFRNLRVTEVCNGKTKPKFYIHVKEEGLYEFEAAAQKPIKREKLKDYVFMKDDKVISLYKGADGKICYRYKGKWVQIMGNDPEEDHRCVRLYHDGWDYYRTHPKEQIQEMGD